MFKEGDVGFSCRVIPVMYSVHIFLLLVLGTWLGCIFPLPKFGIPLDIIILAFVSLWTLWPGAVVFKFNLFALNFIRGFFFLIIITYRFLKFTG